MIYIPAGIEMHTAELVAGKPTLHENKNGRTYRNGHQVARLRVNHS